jgi:hypothetical protein
MCLLVLPAFKLIVSLPEKAEAAPDVEIKRPLVKKGGMMCFGGEKVDAEQHFSGMLVEKNEEVRF